VPKLLTALLLLVEGALSPPLQAVEVDTLMKRVDALWRGESSHATLTMKVKTQRYARSMKMEVWSKGKERSLLLIREPKKDRGIATLKVERNIWNYLPKINRTTKIPASMMGGSWMGSHFTHDDLVKESRYQEEYNSSLSFEGERDGVLIYEVSAIPKPDAAVVWGRVVMTIRQDTLTPIEAIYYDEEGAKVRLMQFDQLQQIGDRTVPMRLTLTPEDKPGESTIIHYQQIAFDLPIEEQRFSLRSLRKRR
jgi:hypothetical protein